MMNFNISIDININNKLLLYVYFLKYIKESIQVVSIFYWSNSRYRLLHGELVHSTHKFEVFLRNSITLSRYCSMYHSVVTVFYMWFSVIYGCILKESKIEATIGITFYICSIWFKWTAKCGKVENQERNLEIN